MYELPRMAIAVSSFISAILIQVKYVVEFGDFIMPYRVFHWTILCKSHYCYCQVLQNESEDPLVRLTFEIHKTSFLGNFINVDHNQSHLPHRLHSVNHSMDDVVQLPGLLLPFLHA